MAQAQGLTSKAEKEYLSPTTTLIFAKEEEKIQKKVTYRKNITVCNTHLCPEQNHDKKT